MLNVFGVRHLSPAAAYHLQKYLDEIKPQAVLIEGPADATEWIQYIVSKYTKPPIALLAYTNEVPVRTILYPFAEYSPEYVGALWGAKNKVRTEFIDLPCHIFLGLQNKRDQEAKAAEDKEDAEVAEIPAPKRNIYDEWAKACGYDDYDTYWETEFEHNLNQNTYREATYEFGKSMRAFGEIEEENLIREAHMRRQIAKVIADGIPAEKIVVITGAYHADVLNTELPAMTDAELKALPSMSTTLTLMPYSNLRLSSRTGYGAGNRSPRYFGMMWKAMPAEALDTLPHIFFTEVARYMRREGTFKSTAEVIEAVRLSQGMASLRQQSAPSLDDLRMAAVTCLGQGELSVVSKAMAAVEVGTEIGELAEGVSRTAIQDDFYKQLTDLKLEKYKSSVAQDLELDLRENRNAKSEKAQWLDLHRSYFLHRLASLGVSFVKPVFTKQESATWKEVWVLQWTPEAEIEIVESSLKGESVEVAAAHSMKEALDGGKTVSDISRIIEQASLCGIPSMLDLARNALQAFTVDSDSFADIATAVGDLSSTISYGDIRRMDVTGLIPLLSQLFLRGTLIVADNAKCNHQAAQELFHHMHVFNKVSLDHYEVVDDTGWLAALRQMADRDDLSPALSGYACALLLERNLVSGDELEVMIVRRLSPGIDADLGVGWFEGLAARNHYGLLSRAQIWELLDKYIETLDSEEFIKALVFLRRTFANFSPQEKRVICDNLGSVWNISGEAVENKIAAEYSESEKATLENLNEFNFDDF